MRTASLLVVFAAAKAIALAGHHVPLTWWSPIAFFWHDAAVVLIFAALKTVLHEVTKQHEGQERSCASWLREKTWIWLVYATLVLYVALNVPVIRVLSTPLTWSMWRAARGPLADSIFLYATWSNVLLSATIVALAVGLPIVFARYVTIHGAAHHEVTKSHEEHETREKPLVPLVYATLIVTAALGPIAAARVDTRGLERNAWTALITTAMPRVLAHATDDDWTAIGFEQAPDGSPTRLRGAAAGRHVILVSLESTAAQYLGLYGAQPDVMPNLSALAEHAIVFDHAYAVYPESIKGLFSILCSVYPAFDTAAESYAAVPCSSVARELGSRGYHTALFHSGRFGYLGMDAIIRDRGYDVLEDAGDIGGQRTSSFGVDEPSTVARILTWIDSLPAGNRFFVTYLPIAGHHPYDTPQPGPFSEQTDLDRYRNALHYGDESLGMLMRGLRMRGLEEKTLWIVLGDHGEAFGQHEGNYGHTFQIFEENVHVPLLAAAPGLIEHPVRRGLVASLIDTAPTVLDLLGVPSPPTYAGRSLIDGTPRMAFFFADYSRGLLGLRDGRFKAIYELDSEQEQLFDLEQDPAERTDIARGDAECARRAAWYARQLRGWSAAQQHRLTAAR